MEPKITVQYRFDRSNEYFASGALIRVKDGKNELHETFCDAEHSVLSLQYQGKPLFQLHGDEYFCPTCEKIVKTSYGLDQTDEFHMTKINDNEASFDEVVEELKPLLGLLQDGYYCLWDTELYPTDGNGHLFWDYPNGNEVLAGSCVYYRGNGEWGTYVPHFMIATQPKRKMNPEQVAYYLERPNARALAYYMDGNLTALIDGHHKAMASAMAHRSCKTIVITKCCEMYRNHEGKEKHYLSANDSCFDMEELGIAYQKECVKKTIEKEEYVIFSMDENDHFPIPINAVELASQYPTVAEHVAMDLFGPVTDEVIDEFLHRKKDYTEDDVCLLLEALGGHRHERLFEVIDFVFYNFQTSEALFTAIEQLSRLSRTDELEDYLIQYVPEIEEEHPDVARNILDILW